MSWLKFDNQEKGFKPFKLTRLTVRANNGKRIVYITSREIDSNRGYCFPRYGTISGIYYNKILFDNGNSEYLKDILECGIEI